MRHLCRCSHHITVSNSGNLERLKVGLCQCYYQASSGLQVFGKALRNSNNQMGLNRKWNVLNKLIQIKLVQLAYLINPGKGQNS